jgi:hypothetical protein
MRPPKARRTVFRDAAKRPAGSKGALRGLDPQVESKSFSTSPWQTLPRQRDHRETAERGRWRACALRAEQGLRSRHFHSLAGSPAAFLGSVVFQSFTLFGTFSLLLMPKPTKPRRG